MYNRHSSSFSILHICSLISFLKSWLLEYFQSIFTFLLCFVWISIWWVIWNWINFFRDFFELIKCLHTFLTIIARVLISIIVFKLSALHLNSYSLQSFVSLAFNYLNWDLSLLIDHLVYYLARLGYLFKCFVRFLRLSKFLFLS